MPKPVTITQPPRPSPPAAQTMRPAYPPSQPHPAAAAYAAHPYNEVTHWRKMYADLITHYESNGHSRVPSASNPTLAAWLGDQERKYMYNTLTSGQIQQLALMKVSFIHSSESKLGVKCMEKKCTKFGAFEGKCHEHYYAQYRMDHPMEAVVVHDPEEKRRKKKEERKAKKAAKAKKSKAKVKKTPVKKSIKKKTAEQDENEDVKKASDEIVVPMLPPMSPDKDVNMPEAEEKSKSEGNEDVNKSADGEDAAAKEIDTNDKTKDQSEEAAKSAGQDADEVSMSSDKGKSETSAKVADGPAKTATSSKKSTADNVDKSLGSIHSVDISTPAEEGKTDSADSKDASKKNNEAESIKKDSESKMPIAATAKKSPAKKTTVTAKGKGKDSPKKDSKPVDPAIAAAINTMLATYPPAKSRPPIAEGIPPIASQPVYQHSYPYGWQPAAPPAQAAGKTPTLQDQHNQNIWLKHYGSLILFYEHYGHSNVTLQYAKEFAPPSLVTWVNQQRERYNKGQLSEDEIKRLDLLGFTEGKVDVSQKKKCVKDDCNKFAVFNGKCHAHYTQSGKLRKREAAPGAAAYNYFNEPPSKKSKKLTKAQEKEIDAKITFPMSRAQARSIGINAFPTGQKGAKAPLMIPANYAGALQPFQTAAKEKPIKKKPVKAVKPKFPNCTKQKDGLWTLTIPGPKEDESKVDNSEGQTNDQDGEKGDKSKRGRPKVRRIKDQTNDQVIEKIGHYVTLLANAQYCISEKNYYTDCTCMHYLRSNPFAVKTVSHAIFDYYEKSNNEKRLYALDRMRQGEQPKQARPLESEGRFFTLPLVYDYVENADIPEKDGQSKYAQLGVLFKHKICSSSWHNLHNHSVKAKETILQYMGGDITVAVQRNLGPKNFRNHSAREKVIGMLQALYDEHAATNTTDEVINGHKVVMLPAAFSKKQLFRKFVNEQGWNVEIVDRKSNKMAKVKDWPLLEGFYATEHEANANNGKVAGQKINHTTFAGLWKDEFPHLKVVEGMMKGDAFLHQRENVRSLLQSLWDEYAVYEDDPEEIVVLPFSKKNLYHTWIREQGWLVKEENGRMAAYKDWELLPGFYETQEEANEKSGKVAGDKISYPSFFNIWKAEFSRLRVTETRTPRKKRSNYHSDDEA